MFPGDNEILAHLRQAFHDVCQSPYAVECRTREILGQNVSHVPWDETGDVFTIPCSPNQGLLCEDSQQTSGLCHDYELRFHCPPDVNECETSSPCTDPNAHCINTYGSYFCRCKEGYYLSGDTCQPGQACTGWGDPHYTTFDKKKFHFQGTCDYILTEPCLLEGSLEDTLPYFRVLAKNEYRSEAWRMRRLSFTKTLTLEVYGYEIQLRQDRRVSIRGVEHTLPIRYSNVDPERPGSFLSVRLLVEGVVLTTDYGLFVQYDGETRFRITVPEAYAGSLCGLCGNYDGVASNDFVLRNGTSTQDVNDFGNSYKDEDLSDLKCSDGETPHPECSTPEDLVNVNKKCHEIADSEGPFAPCHATVPPAEYESDCVYDLCADPGKEEVLCEAVKAYAAECEEHGIIVSWRTQEFCPPDCVPYSHFSLSVSSCPATCTEPAAPLACDLPNVSGCVCDFGFLLSGDSCVQPEMCGCIASDGNYHMLGDRWYDGNCSTLCECRDEGGIVCDYNVACHSDGECVSLPDGSSTCVCQDGFAGHPENCTDVDECAKELHYCHDGADCMNLDGGFSCQCSDGFVGDGMDCEDIDECPLEPCHVHATCVNEPGGYQCFCDSGYTGDGHYCQGIVDIDPGDGEHGCSYNQELCSALATCQDQEDGTFQCHCPSGALGDGLKNGTGCRYPPCIEGFVEDGFDCYKFISDEVPFTDARRVCQDLGAELASFSSAASLDFLLSYAQLYSIEGSFWLGYSDSLWDGTYVWFDGSVSEVDNWAADEPSQAPGHDCVFVDVGFNSSFKFTTGQCDSQAQSICERSRVPFICPSGWTETDAGACVAVFNQNKTYFDAYMTCVAFGADLIIPENDEVIEELQIILNPDTSQHWVGFNDGLFNELDGLYESLDGTMNLTLGSAESTPKCVSLDPVSGHYEHTSCENPHKFVCSRQLGVHHVCPQGSMRYQDKCYKLKTQTYLPQYDAWQICLNMGGDLISIATLAEQIFFQQLIEKRLAPGDYWIGLTEGGENGNYSWSDGTEFIYSNWAAGEPSDPAPYNCVSARQSLQNSWQDTSCELQLPFICEYMNTPCSSSIGCHENGECHLGQCRCQSGYHGDGRYVCLDLDECTLHDPCDVNAECANTPGSYNCTCNDGFAGNGTTCINLLACEGDVDCHINGYCNSSKLCQCSTGYTGNGKAICTNVDECLLDTHDCHTHADCFDTDGFYECVCEDGYTGNGRECQDTPTSCDFIKQKDPAATNGVYQIDPDGPGGVDAFNVECDMSRDIGVTIIEHDRQTRVGTSNKPAAESYIKILTYKFSTVTQIKALITLSGFCYQSIKFECRNGAQLSGYLGTGIDDNIYSWPGGTEAGQCACGAIGSCTNPSSQCNCDGITTSTAYDFGKITNETQLPVTKLVLGELPGSHTMYHTISALYCAPRQIDVPANCDEAKWVYGIKYDTPVLIDVDGPLGDDVSNVQPFLAQCDMTSLLYQAITQIPHDHGLTVSGTGPSTLSTPLSPEGARGPQTPLDAGTYPINYPIPVDALLKLIQVSGFCSQYVEYQCNNSRIISGGEYYTSVSRVDGTRLDYWPGGFQQADMCGCGLTRSCDQPDVTCNCDIMDGVPRRDFGLMTHKDDLPIGGVTVQDVGEGRSANYSIGWLRCAPVQFGIETSCQEIRSKAQSEQTYSNYTYLIDPDGPVYPKTSYGRAHFNKMVNEGEYDAETTGLYFGMKGDFYLTNVPPFPVRCEFPGDTWVGITIMPHDGPNDTPVTNEVIPINYKNVDRLQISKVVTRSTYCVQEIKYDCVHSALHNPDSYWESRWDETSVHHYFDGTEGSSCACSNRDNMTCDESNVTCNCDIRDHQQRSDSGEFANKDHLPVTAVRILDVGHAGSQGVLTLGDLKCYEAFPTCYHVYSQAFQVFGQSYWFRYFWNTVDPDGVYGVDPFIVGCIMPYKTIIYPYSGSITLNFTETSEQAQYEGAHASCLEIGYYYADHDQLTALVAAAGYCSQFVSFSCQYSPFTTHAYWENHQGERRPGWGDSADGSECACGMTDTCDGGPSMACNCDNNDGILREDHGYLINKTHLPVSRVCHGFSEITVPGGSHKSTGVLVKELICSPHQIEIEKDCQMYRNRRHTSTETYLIDPDGTYGEKPFPAYCEMTEDPPLGVTVITHDKSGCQGVDNQETEINVTYNALTDVQLTGLIDGSIYCKQEMTYECTDAELDLDGAYGWYQLDGTKNNYWAGNTDGTGCSGSDCQCNVAPPGESTEDGGWLLNKEDLPVTRVQLNPVAINASRCLRIEPLRCYSVYKNCHEIHLAGAKYNPLYNQRYAVDPDAAPGVEVFSVKCDFSTSWGIGISVANHDADYVHTIPDVAPGSENMQILYKQADFEQIQELTKTSGYCAQELYYSCKNLPLINDADPLYSYFRTWDGRVSRAWAGADTVNTTGCACLLLGTCPVNHTCRCDSMTSELTREGGLVTNKQLLPISEVVYGGVNGADSEGYFETGPVKCGPKPFSLPKDCHDARKKGMPTGEILIWPNANVDPFLVYCDMERVPNFGVTIIIPELADRTEADSVVEITYKQANYEQVNALVSRSAYCYLPVKLNCFATNYLGNQGLGNHFVDDLGNEKFYFDGTWARKCSCGTDQKCGGHDSQAQRMARPCNCDVGDNVWRTDVGVLLNRNHMPPTEFFFNLGDNPNKTAYFSIDKLYCAPTTIDLDECGMDYHDCHHWADCTNTNTKYMCTCRPGYQGLGVEGVWANGRECYDDDECALNQCPLEADCENTVGSFICHCKDGFRKIAPTECEDINECLEDTHTCDENAKCHNTYGSFYCSCRDGFRGDGYSCEEIGQCKCWGDPHCTTFDRHTLHFQGACQYILARDGCINNYPATQPTFQIIQKNWRDYEEHELEVSWTKEVYIMIHGYNITLGQHKWVFVNGLRALRLPRKPDPLNHPNLVITTLGIYIHVKTDIGVEVYWDGETKVEVIVVESYKNATCGICGDYNGDQGNDWMIGPSCPEQSPATVTDNNNLFGHSWMYLDTTDPDPKCHQDCDSPPDEDLCEDEAAQLEAEELCQSLYDPNGRFAACIPEIGASELDSLLESCIYDTCGSDSGICVNAEALAARCQQDFKVDIGNWRAGGFCSMECPVGLHYTTCASPCEKKCNTSTTECLDTVCVEGCVCPEGMIRDGDRCITEDQCGCEYGGNYYSVGDRIVPVNCTLECTCPAPLGQIKCTPLTCHDDASCLLEDGLYDCFCDEGYEGTGVSCTDVDECSSSDPPCDPNALCENTIGSFDCTCNDGFQGNGLACTDIDECINGNNDCDDNGECFNTVGSYECHCESGYYKPVNTSHTCSDVDECGTNRNDCDRETTVCNNTDGSYDCVCKPGHEQFDDCRCTDINECLEPMMNNCHDNAICQNIIGDYVCQCDTGYRGNGTYCEDIDECTHTDYNECSDDANCTNTIGSYQCTCHEGYTGDGQTCTDINECTDPDIDTGCTPLVDGGRCVNTPGSYHCDCRSGFTGDGLTSGDGCTDIDECSLQPPPCGSFSNCTNSPGSYTCACISDDYYSSTGNGKDCLLKPTCDDVAAECSEVEVCVEGPQGAECLCITGYERSADGICTDINECSESPGPCTAEHTECVNTAGSYMCECVDGYTQNSFNHLCEDVNECDLDLDTCDSLSEECVNDEGSFHCECAEGFESVIIDGEELCSDINECLEVTRCHCDVNADCYNSPGGCTCQCKEGFTGDGLKCDDINECDIENNPCHQNADCYEIYGGHECTCHDGFRGNGRECENINECEENLHNCLDNTVCVDTEGGFYCQCVQGYQGHCDQCLDIDECLTHTDECHRNADCINTLGSYYCQCHEGFLGSGRDCSDKDECILGLTDCDDNADCWNIPGSYECHCMAGYHLTVNNTCADVDECSTSHHICSSHAQCNNTDGSYTCTCLEGYVGNGVLCILENPEQCGDHHCDPHATCQQNVFGERQCICMGGYEGVGYIQNGRPGCVELDPCSHDVCDPDAVCHKVSSRAVCICQPGYRGDGLSCTPVSPCEDYSVCGLGAICTEANNTDGFECQCSDGYTLVDGYNCEDVNECETGSANCTDVAMCVNNQGSYRCICPYGYTEDADGSCIDVDECNEGQDDCDSENRAFCLNNEGSYTCQCISPQYSGDGKFCIENGGSGPACDIECPSNSYCVSADSQEQCVCKRGFTLNQYANGTSSCIDINECDLDPCHANAGCTNQSPGYTCACDEGYIGSGVFCQDINECDYGSDECDVNAICENSEGGYNCTCKQGYKGSGMECSPISPEEDVCGCGPNGVCDSVRLQCDCNDGYHDNPSHVAERCQDVNECDNPMSCHPAAECDNLIGGYTCQCPSGMSGDGFTFCDENECETGKAQCSLQANCTDLLGYYQCTCVEGFIGDGFSCYPESDPCTAEAEEACGDHAVCVNHRGGAMCECESGYRGDGEECVDVNECEEMDDIFRHECDENALCINFDGGYFCICQSGFLGNGKKCNDLDECTNEVDGCSSSAICSNTVGGYECICQPGMTGDGFTCHPSKECDLNGGGCHSNASCVSNAVGAHVCSCHDGFQGDGYTCEDIDECVEDEELCGTTADCVNLPGSNDCVCKPGYTGTGFMCTDINECWDPVAAGCGSHTECLNTDGSYHCVCEEGYYLAQNGTCTDFDECQAEWNICADNATCTNTQGSYLCSCEDGYYGDGVICQDIDECSLGIATCTENTMCYNTPGDFTCGCLYGYIEEEENCTDVDECADPALNECDENAQCINTDGGYSCHCNAGYHGNGVICIKPSPCDVYDVCMDNATCVEIGNGQFQCICPDPLIGDGITICYAPNECALGIDDDCDDNALCTDTYEGYECSCPPGFTGDGQTCTDIDECDADSLGGGGHSCDTANGMECSNKPDGEGYNCVCGAELHANGGCGSPGRCATEATCSENADCINRWSGYICRCHDGFEGNGQTCADIDECTTEDYYCSPGSVCQNTHGGYECICSEGYSENINGICEDVNECEMNLDDCHELAVCTNTWGGFLCLCPPGYTGDGVTCEDVDECVDHQDPCHPSAHCTNTPGSCICTCENGYTGDGIVCVEEEQCPQEGVDQCVEHAYCAGLNGPGPDFLCQCHTGYQGDGDNSCTDIDECEMLADACHEYATCHNTDGGYTCTCREGFFGNGKYCEDIDECSGGTHNCDAYADCHNILGNYECICREGYTGNGRTCVQENECTTGNNECAPGALCTDLVGSYRCQCREGYTGNGKTCTDVNECGEQTDDCHHLAVCSNTPGSYTCQCQNGYSGDGTHCTDINECDSVDTCQEFADCVNVPGSFICHCQSGFVQSDLQCIDIDECIHPDRQTECEDSGAVCVNLPGSYKCQCPHGYKFGADGNCQDVNECWEGDGAGGVCGDGGTCQNTEGSCLCACQPGYTTPPSTTCGPCTDIDECTSTQFPHRCGIDNRCVNNEGGYDCICDEGFQGMPSNCSDTDECQQASEIGIALCGVGECINNRGSYYCLCPEGYTFTAGTCENVDECSLPSVHPDAQKCVNSKCIDTEGGYGCECDAGYQRVSSRLCEDKDECLTPDMCQVNGTCINLPGGFVCDCPTGFRQSAQRCIDVDECVEYPSLCGGPKSSQCINVEGSYDCVCLHGYRMINDQCEDIDECIELSGVCGNSSVCLNMEGSYSCSCPEGYTSVNGLCHNVDECLSEHSCDTNAVCTDNEGSYTCQCKHGYIGNGRYCDPICKPQTCPELQSCIVFDSRPHCVCRCEGADCLNQGEVCGTDGQTYPSHRDLQIHACRLNLTISQNYRGPCQDVCGEVECASWKQCEVQNGMPVCVCTPCDPMEEAKGPVCSAQGNTYPNLCVLMSLQCQTGGDDALADYGPCENTKDCEYTEWSDWSICSVTCNEGEQYRTRQISREPLFGDGTCMESLVQTDFCYKGPCPGDLCESHTCSRPAEYCIVDDATGLPRCKCPDCTYVPKDELCVEYDGKKLTAYNKCTIDHYACVTNRPYSVMHPGKCNDGQPDTPLECTVLPHTSHLTTNDNCTSTDPLEMNKCSGGCGDQTGLCCIPTHYDYKPQQFTCDEGNVMTARVMQISACGCISDDKAQEPPRILH